MHVQKSLPTKILALFLNLAITGSIIAIPQLNLLSLAPAHASGVLTYRGVDVMKWTKDTLTNQPSDAQIDNIVSAITTSIVPTHIAISVPLDASSDYPSSSTPSPRTAKNFTQKWSDSIHNHGAKILWRGTWSGIEGLYNFPRLVGPSRFPAGTAATAATDGNSTWLGKTYNYIVNNPSFFQNGDIWAPMPERTEGIFQDSTSFLSYSSPGIQANYANFFNALKTVSGQAFSQIGKNVTVGLTTNNFSEANSGWLPQSIFDTAGMTVVDHYGITHTAAEMDSDLRRIYAQHGKPIFLQEWGDYWNSALSTADRTTYLNGMYAVFQQLVSDGILVGFNYWGAWTGNQEGILTDAGGGNFQVSSRGLLVANFFANSTGTPPPPPPPAPTASLSASPASIQSGGSSTLSWSTTNASSASFDQNIGAVATAGTRVVSPTATTTYTLTASGNGGSTTKSATVTVTSAPPPSDTTPPTVSISSPVAGSTVSATISINANASDNVGVVGVQFKLDGNNLGSEDTTQPYSVPWNTTGAGNGGHSLTATARDAAGNNATSSTVSITVFNTTPPPAKSHLGLNPASLAFSAVSGGIVPAPQSVTLSNTGTASSTWVGTTNQSWCHVAPGAGTLATGSTANFAVSVDALSNAGTASCSVTISDANADNSPQTLAVSYTVSAPAPPPSPPPPPSSGGGGGGGSSSAGPPPAQAPPPGNPPAPAPAPVQNPAPTVTPQPTEVSQVPLPPSDNNPPRISLISVFAITTNSATISWSTNKPTNGQVEYGLSSLDQGSDVADASSLTLSHTLTLSGLNSGSTYRFRVRSGDVYANFGMSKIYSFTTKRLGQSLARGVVLPYNVQSGEIVKFGSNPTVYLVQTGGLHPFDNFASFIAYTRGSGMQLKVLRGRSNRFTILPTFAKIVLGQGSVLGASISLPNGTLVKVSNTIYIIINEVKVPFVSMEAFLGQGYSLANVIELGQLDFPLDSRQKIANPEQAHPYGSWIESQGKLYYMHETGLIEVPNQDIFIANGGLPELILSANEADLNILKYQPKLQPLQAGDKRVY